MWDVVSTILTEQAIQEMEERGLEGLDIEVAADNEAPWEVVAGRKAPKRKNKGMKITLVDVRQQQHARPASVRISSFL